ncbi:hypothetical protein RU87_GL000881 [Lactococcus plantarum]|uniref:Uncharacterized protein n=1 Tax=Pseudolactococcus plantarum TaxID=1365 RepID=A0A2A5S2J0_9LACT|nr:hypothetical protein RU87_GL000881 [Lactococcus plantarum]
MSEQMRECLLSSLFQRTDSLFSDNKLLTIAELTHCSY